jgi:hypothetical protein
VIPGVVDPAPLASSFGSKAMEAIWKPAVLRKKAPSPLEEWRRVPPDSVRRPATPSGRSSRGSRPPGGRQRTRPYTGAPHLAATRVSDLVHVDDPGHRGVAMSKQESDFIDALAGEQGAGRDRVPE